MCFFCVFLQLGWIVFVEPKKGRKNEKKVGSKPTEAERREMMAKQVKTLKKKPFQEEMYVFVDVSDGFFCQWR